MAYSATQDSYGNYVIYQDGTRISTGSSSILGNYGLTTDNLGGTTTTTSTAPTTTTNTLATTSPSLSTALTSPTYSAPSTSTSTSTTAPYTAPTGSTVTGGYVTYQTANGPAYFQQTSSGLAAVTDQTTLAGLKNGTISSSPSTVTSSTVFANPSQPAPAPSLTPAPAGAYGSDLANSMDTTKPIPSSVFGSGTNTSALYQSAMDIYNNMQDTQAKLLAAATPSPEELDLQHRLTELNTQLQQGIVHIKGQAIPTPLVGEQSQKLQENYAFEIKPLQDELDALVKARATTVDALTRVMQYDPMMLNALMNIQKLTQPNVLSTQVNQQTGQVYAILQDPSTGQVGTMPIGSIGPGNAKQYVSTGVYQGGDGSQFFYGVSADGTITNSKLMGAPTTGTAGGFTLSSGQTRYDSNGVPIATAPGGGGSTEGADLAEAKAAIATGNITIDDARQRFLTKYPNASAAWDSYFSGGASSIPGVSGTSGTTSTSSSGNWFTNSAGSLWDWLTS